MCMRNTSEGCILSEQQSALKKAEIAANYAVDKARFNLA